MIEQKLRVDIIHSILCVNDESQTLDKIISELVFRFRAASANIAKLLVILAHDDELILMRGAQVRQNRLITEIGCPRLVLLEGLR